MLVLGHGQALHILLLATYVSAFWPFSSSQASFTPTSRNDSRTADPRLQRAPSTSPPEKKKEMAQLLDKFAPIFKLASTERFYPSSVKWMLDRYDYIEYLNHTKFDPLPGTLSPGGLGSLEYMESPKRMHLSTEHPANAQPIFNTEPSYFMYGPAGQEGALEMGPDGRGRVHDEVYGFWVDQGHGVVLVDVCDDRGALWDTKGHVVPIEFWNGPEYGHRIEHTGDQSWLEFEGKWGNVGDGCWYEPFIGICQLIAGPPGPNREFGIPPSCILAPPADAGSTFKFYLSNWVVWQAQDLNVTHVLLEQVCTRPSMGASARDPYSVAPLEVHDRLPFDPEDRFYEATAARCEGGRSAAKGYRLALYRGEERVSTSPVRVICVYDEGQGAYIDSPGVDVMDWDDWRWKLVIDK
ncbi:protein-vacuolar targeting-related protein [Trichosporon asahii var. asahii CBS 8904]|uniref:Protein-vacuolar targeting-related protein n=1 Tax=Trichosporon asahii var. asahii (strain CBS 8904) TaxID=1220162 RepID=K1VWB6_TRIAC|nr:protein-vacuolar targeting-related protein [Trichosporon asahii var. asahii CBS 8904]